MGKLIIWLLAAGKMGKLLTTCGTMLISIVVYSWVFGWRYAVGFVLLIFFHEMGHYVAARRRGINVGAPTFIPFVGAWIALKELPHDVETEAYIGFAGPHRRHGGVTGLLLCGARQRQRPAVGAGVFRLHAQSVQPDPDLAAGRRPHHGHHLAQGLAGRRAAAGGAVLLPSKPDADPGSVAGVPAAQGSDLGRSEQTQAILRGIARDPHQLRCAVPGPGRPSSP
jgi:hypothetical protein